MIENALPDDPTPKTLKTVPLDAWHRALGARMVEFAGYCHAGAVPGRAGRTPALPGAGGTVRRLAHGPGDTDRRHRSRRAGAAGARRPARPEAGPAALHAADQRGGRHPRRPDGGESRRRATVPGGECQPQGDRLHPHRRQPAVRRAAPAARGPRPAGTAGPCRRRGDRPPRPRGRADCRSWAWPRSRSPGIPCLVSRSGYTGEDGFEISRPRRTAPRPWRSAFWTNPRSSPPVSAHAIRCGWRQACASTATTSTS